MNEFFATLLQAVLTAVVPVLAAFAARLLNTKAEEAREYKERSASYHYIEQVYEAVSGAVNYVSQTYVNTLKESDSFGVENQREALNKALKKAKSLLAADALHFAADTYGDVNDYLTTLIEAEICKGKKE